MEFAREYWFLLPLLVFGLPMGVVLAYLTFREWRRGRQVRDDAILTLSETLQKGAKVTGGLAERFVSSAENIELIMKQLLQQGEQIVDLAEATFNALVATRTKTDDEEPDDDPQPPTAQLP